MSEEKLFNLNHNKLKNVKVKNTLVSNDSF